MSEALRLLAVERFVNYNLQLDNELQQLTLMASEICETPVALITLIDKDKQWLKVRLGTDETVLPREFSFCSHAIEDDGIMIVPDMLNDVRFVDNPLVVNDPNIRFYAGAPLISRDGFRLGTLCVVDMQPHELNKYQQLMLEILSRQAINIMELKVSRDLLSKHAAEVAEQRRIIEHAETRLRSFFESSSSFHVLLGARGEVLDFNKTAYNFLKRIHNAEINIGCQMISFIDMGFKNAFLKKYNLALSGKKSVAEGKTDYHKHGLIYWEATFEPAKNNDDKIIGVSYLIQNVTERKLQELKIIDQNESLINIAYIQAHEYRGPLTSIMGMVNVIKDESYNLPDEVISLLDGAANKLDRKINEVINTVNKIVETGN